MRWALLILIAALVGCRERAKPDVNLSVKWHGNSAELRWVPNAQLNRVRYSQLRIVENGGIRLVPIDPASMTREGSFTYEPKSDNASVTIELETSDARHIAESVMLVNPRSTPPLVSNALLVPEQALPQEPPPQEQPKDEPRSPTAATRSVKAPDFRLPPRDPRLLAAPPTLAAFHSPDTVSRRPGPVVQTPVFPR